MTAEIWAEATSEPIGRMELAYMAVAMRDPNLVHVDDDFARASGFDRVIAHGTFALGYLADLVASRHGPGAIRDLDVTLRAPVLVGQRIHASASVETTAEDGTVRLDLRAIVDDGTVVATGSATVLGRRD
jgi:acyl dehydratase